MVVCTTEGCENVLGRNNKSGFCQHCSKQGSSLQSQVQGVVPKSLTDLNEGNIESLDQIIAANLLDSPISSLTVAGIVSLINVVTKPLIATVVTLEKQLKVAEDMIKVKEGEIADLKNKTSTSEIIQNQHKEIREIIDNHQQFLEKTDAYRRENNLVVFGLKEAETTTNTEGDGAQVNDETQVNAILTVIGCGDVVPEKVMRLGKINPENNTGQAKKRPLLVVLKSAQERKKVLINSSKLKEDETFNTTFIKKDQTPQERKEWARLRRVLSDEKDRPANAGIEVKIDYRRKCVMVGERIVDRGNFQRGPEM